MKENILKNFVKNVLVIALGLLITSLYAYSNPISDTIYALTPKAVHKNSLKKGEILELYVVSTGFMSDDVNLYKGDIIKVKITKYRPETRGRKDAYYRIVTQDVKGLTMVGSMHVAKDKDFKTIAKSAGVTVAGHILNASFLGQAIAVSKGLIKPNKNESRIQSAGHNLYESTPLRYFSKGNSFEIEQYGVVVLKLKEMK